MHIALRALIPAGLVGLGTLTVLATAAPRRVSPRGDAPASIGSGTPVVVELFSSEGCSSCPPADEYLRRLDREQPIPGVAVIALEMHVDYWNDLGWKDPFSDAAYSVRQRRYATVLPDRRVYTPELVADGLTTLNGDEARSAEILRRSAARPRAEVTVAISDDVVTVRVANAPPPPAGDVNEVWLAVTESDLATTVPAGENRGRTLTHAPVVRALRKLGVASAGAFDARVPLAADAEWRRRGLRAVVLVQHAGDLAIVGAGTAA